MPDEARPKRPSRRRARSRRKKSADTIDSINPGRAPLGAARPLHRGQPRMGSVPGAWPEEAEEHNVQRSTTPAQPLQRPAHLLDTPSSNSTSIPWPPQSTPVWVNPSIYGTPPYHQSPGPAFFPVTPYHSPYSSWNPRPLPPTPVFFNPSIYGTPPYYQHPGPAVPRNPSWSWPRSYASRLQGINSLALSPLPLRNRVCRSLPSMTNQRASSHPTMYSVSQDESHEIDDCDFNELPSSQPVSLSQLCTRANSRMKTSRPSKRLQLDSEDHDFGSRSTVVIRRPHHDKPQTRISMIHHAKSKSCGLHIHQEEVLKPTRYGTAAGTARLGEMAGHPRQNAWHDQMDIHRHRNPLNYATEFGSPFTYSISQPDVSTPGSPFMKRDQPHGEYGTWPADRSKRLFSDPSLENPYAHVGSEGAQLPGSSLSLYRDSFDRSEDQSPYESLRVQRSGYNPPDVRGLTTNLQSSFVELHSEQHSVKYRAVAYHNMGRVLSRESDAHPGQAPPRPESPVSPPVYAPDNDMHPHRLNDSSAKEDDSLDQKDDATRILTERINARIEEISENARFDGKQTEEDCASDGCDYCAPNLQGNAGPVSSVSVDTTGSGQQPHQSLSVAPHNDWKDQYLGSLPLWTSSNRPEASSGYLYEELMEKLTKDEGVSAPASSDVGTRTVRPPPGIPDPVVRNTASGPSYLEKSPHSVDARLNEADAWFHADGRGEEQLRQQVADIADNYASRIARLEGVGGLSLNSTMAKQMTLLLGNSVVNLHSYVSQGAARQMGSFSNFGRVRSRHCEPSLGGRRSYFDRDPSIGHWRLPSGGIRGMGQDAEEWVTSSPDDFQRCAGW